MTSTANNTSNNNSGTYQQPILVRNLGSLDSALTSETTNETGRSRSSTMASGLLLGGARATFSRNSTDIDPPVGSMSVNDGMLDTENNLSENNPSGSTDA
jgi:hypothetical protein